MKKINFSLMAIAVTAILAASCAKDLTPKPYNQGINVIPVPVELTQTDTVTRFVLAKTTKIVITSPDMSVPAEYFAAKIKRSTGYELTVAEGQPGDAGAITLELDTRVPVGAEGYTLSSTATGVTIKARTPQGAFYGIQTLLQLFPAEIESPEKISGEWSIPAVEVKDEPRFVYRSIMLDPCRHFLDVEFIKKQLDVMAMFKLNKFHWHLTEDQAWRIEIKKYPKLTQSGAVRTEGDGATYGPFFYTQEQIKEVVAYAAERYIDVIPEIEIPGHALAALTGYPEYSCTGGPFKQPRIIWGVEEDVYCPGKDSTFLFIQDILDEVVALFPYELFHIGGDECPKVRWAKCPDCQKRIKDNNLQAKDGHSAEERLQAYTIKRAQDYLAAKGKRIIGWDEILEGGVSQDAIIMSWRNTNWGVQAAKKGNQVIMSPNPNGMYLDHYQGAPEVEPVTIGGYQPLEKVYAFEPMPVDSILPVEFQKNILGMQGNMWAEYLLTPEMTEYMLYPKVLVVAETDWSPASNKDWADFSRRLDNALVRLDMHGINYHIPQPEGIVTQNVVFVTDSTDMEFKNTRNLKMVYTLDGSEPTAKSTLYTTPIKVGGKGEVKIATLLVSGKMSKVRTVPYEKQELRAAAKPLPADTTKMGAKMRVAEGLFPTQESFATAKFGQDTIVARLFEGQLWDMNKPSLAEFTGFIALPEDGVYTFTSDMDELWIDGVKVLENPKLARHYRMKAQIALAAGQHEYKIVFNNMIKDGWPNNWNRIGFQYKLPSGAGGSYGGWIEAGGNALTY